MVFLHLSCKFRFMFSASSSLLWACFNSSQSFISWAFRLGTSPLDWREQTHIIKITFLYKVFGASCCLRFQLRRGETSACRLHFDPLSSPTLRSWKHTEVKLLKSDHLSLRSVRGCEELRPTSPGPPEALDETLPSHPSRSWETEGAVSPSVPLTRPLPYTQSQTHNITFYIWILTFLWWVCFIEVQSLHAGCRLIFLWIGQILSHIELIVLWEKHGLINIVKQFFLWDKIGSIKYKRKGWEETEMESPQRDTKMCLCAYSYSDLDKGVPWWTLTRFQLEFRV